MFIKIRDVLISRKLAVFLLFIFLILLIFGSLMPKIKYYNTSELTALKSRNFILYKLATIFSPTEMSKNWFFIILTGLLFIATLLCIIYRLKQLKRKPPTEISMPDKCYFQDKLEITDVETLVDKINGLKMIKKWPKYIIENNNNLNILARPKSYKLIGSMLFHASLLLIIIAGVITALFSLNAGIVVTEGQTIPINKETMVEATRKPVFEISELPEIEINLEKVEPVLNDKGEFIQFKTIVNLTDSNGDEISNEIKINKPALLKGYRLSLEKYGPAPWLEISDKKSGAVIYDSFFNIKAGTEAHDSIYIPDSDKHIMVRYFPDFYQEGKKVGTRSSLPKNPVFWIYTGDLKELLKKGETAELGPWRIKYKEFRQWSYFRVTRDPGEIWLYLGSALAIVGLFLRFSKDEKRVGFIITKNEDSLTIQLNGHASYFPALFEDWMENLWSELNRITNETER